MKTKSGLEFDSDIMLRRGKKVHICAACVFDQYPVFLEFRGRIRDIFQVSDTLVQFHVNSLVQFNAELDKDSMQYYKDNGFWLYSEDILFIEEDAA